MHPLAVSVMLLVVHFSGEQFRVLVLQYYLFIALPRALRYLVTSLVSAVQCEGVYYTIYVSAF